jgi:hypothetical protein
LKRPASGHQSNARPIANRIEAVAISEDDVESASMYVTDWLRSFAESSIDGLLLEEERGDGQASAQALATYQPVINAALRAVPRLPR